MTAFEQRALQDASVISEHRTPPVSPQEWDCGCVTAVYVTDRDSFAGEKAFEMRLAHDCKSSGCEIRQRGGEIRSQAVEKVDASYGYTIEFSSTPAHHSLDYDEEENKLRAEADLPPLTGE